MTAYLSEMRFFKAISNKQSPEIQQFRRCQLCLFILLLWYMQGVDRWLKIHSEVPDILTITQITQIVFLRFLFHKAWWLILPLTNFTWRIAYLASKYWFLACYQVVNVERSSDLRYFLNSIENLNVRNSPSNKNENLWNQIIVLS